MENFVAEDLSSSRSAFTLIELLVVIAIIAILSVVVLLTLNPSELLKQSRDSTRLSDIDTMNHALSLYATDQSSAPGFTLGNASTTYISIPDPSATSTAGDQCQGLGLPALPSGVGYVYHCAASSTYRSIDGTGWIPINLKVISSGIPISQLPVDPSNQSSSNFFYTYNTDGTTYEITTALESLKYRAQFTTNPAITGYPKMAMAGTSQSLSPIYSSTGLVAYWPLDEGSGSSATDYSGNGHTGTWNGTMSGTGGTYYAGGKVGTYAGYFNGSNNYINIGDPIAYGSGLSPRSMCAWAELNSIPGSYAWILAIGTASAGSAMFIGASTNGLDGGAYTNDIGVSNFWTAGVWNFVCLTYDGATASLYANGSLVASAAKTWSLVPNVGYIGKQVNNNEPWPGLIDDARIYSRVLSPAEVKALYNLEK